MRTVEKYLIAMYFAICPIEIALHLIITSSTKYLGLLIVLAWGIRLLSREKKMSVNITSTVLSLMIWLLYCIISIGWGTRSNNTYEYITTYLQMGLLFFVCVEDTWNKDDLKIFLNSLLIGSLAMSIVAVLFGDMRYRGRETILILGRYCDPNQLAANIIPGALVGLWLMINSEEMNQIRIFGGIAFAIISSTVIRTGSRGGFIGLFIGVIVFILFGKHYSNKKIVYFIITICIVFMIFNKSPITTRNRLLDFDRYTETYQNGRSRLIIWKDLLKDFDIKWILGHGPGSTSDYFQRLYGKAIGVHNTYLLVLYEVGMLGFVLFIYPFWSLIKSIIKKRNDLLLAIMIATGICSFFLDALLQRYIWNALILCEIWSNVDYNNAIKEINPKSKYIRYY